MSYISSKKSSSNSVSKLYLKGRLTITEIAQLNHVSSRTVYRKLSQLSPVTITPNCGQKIVLLIDTTYWGRRFGVVIFKDNLSGCVLWYKFIYRKEKITDYEEGIAYLERQQYHIRGIVCDGLIGLKDKLLRYPIQHCQFHMVQTVIHKLTRHPKTQAGKELLDIIYLLCRTDKESFIGIFNDWQMRWKDYLLERTTDPNNELKKPFKHQHLRSAARSIRTHQKWLWTFYDRPDLQLPNTNNAMEALNSNLKDLMRRHRGISIQRRECLISALLEAHKPKRIK